MKKRNYKLAGLAVVLFLLYSMAWPLYYRSDQLAAKVIDVETGLPIEGAVVVVKWKIEKPRLHGHDYRTLHSVQAITDRNGSFQTEAWGAKYAGVLWKMGGSSPTALVLKSGYEIESASNYSIAFGGFHCPGSKFARISRGITHARTTVVASWNECEIPLKRFRGDPDEYASRLSWVQQSLCDEANGIKCSEALKAYFAEERLRLEELGAQPYSLNQIR
jgi:hypothetical protein